MIASGPQPSWRLSLVVPKAAAEAFEAAVDMAAGLSTFETADGDLWRIDAWFAAPPDLAALNARACAVAAAHGLPPPELRVTAVPEVDWVSRSQTAQPPISAGRFHVHGRHDRGTAPAGAIAIELEAGQAFGTGRHETTRGCLLMLDRLARRRRYRRCLDLGCGSGVLAIAMARRWRRPVLASDIDPVAVATARENARHNHVGRLVGVFAADGIVPRRRRAYDLIVANILARPLVRLAPAVSAASDRDGCIVLSGLLKSQERQVLSAYRAFGFSPWYRITLGDWPTLALRRPA